MQGSPSAMFAIDRKSQCDEEKYFSVPYVTVNCQFLSIFKFQYFFNGRIKMRGKNTNIKEHHNHTVTVSTCWTVWNNAYNKIEWNGKQMSPLWIIVKFFAGLDSLSVMQI